MGTASTEASATTGFEALSDDEKAKVERVLFLLDKFCVGDLFYHELTMVLDGLPKSYLVKQRRDQLNSICHITCTPGSTEGAQMVFTDLLREWIKDCLASHPGDQGKPVKVKISRDGARMTNSTFILLSFALLQAGNDVMSSKGNHTNAVAKGKEDYQTMQTSSANVFQDINSVINKEKIVIDGITIDLEFFLGVITSLFY